jgi:hypothetical protein
MPLRIFIRLGMRLLYPVRSGPHNGAQTDLCIGQVPIPSQPISESKTVLLPIVEMPLVGVIKGA